jgi:hypothetical protein
MAGFANTDRVAEVCRLVAVLTEQWDTDHRVRIDAVQPLTGAWLAIVYRNPATGPRSGLVFDLDDFAAGFAPGLKVTELAGEIVQSFIIEPGGPGLANTHPWLKGLNEALGPLRWRGDAINLPSGSVAAGDIRGFGPGRLDTKEEGRTS